MVKMKNCNFFVNEPKRTVTCVYYVPVQNAPRYFVEDNTELSFNIYDFSSRLVTNRIYVGVARCNPEDTWDESIGKLVAYYKMKNAYFQDFFKKINNFYGDLERSLDNLESKANDLGMKLNRELFRLENQIKKQIEEKKA